MHASYSVFDILGPRSFLSSAWRRLLPLFAVAALSGCSQSGLEDLEQFINQARMEKGSVTPLPKFKPAETFIYTAYDSRDPFRNWQLESLEDLAKNGSGHGLQPDTKRPREKLENFPLDSLHLRGTLEIGEVRWALIGSPDNIVYKVKTGNHLGRNFGRIDSIKEDTIHLTEIVSDGLGGWQERKSTLTSKSE
ncbi:MAG: pilus assembly protein PilP [Gammaproteobacteria bacterium]|nr:pilus assembly protein PilP [Gammaproteobacteria bacterium]